MLCKSNSVLCFNYFLLYIICLQILVNAVYEFILCCVLIRKYPDITDCNFNASCHKYFWHNLLSKDLLFSHPTQCLLLRYFKNAEQAEYPLRWTKLSENISDFINSNLKKDCQIFIIFDTNVPDTVGYQTTAHIRTSSNVCFWIPWEEQNKWNMCWNEYKSQ